MCKRTCCDRVRQNKNDIKYSGSGTTVDYQQAKHMEFVPQLSNGTENDTVTVPNIPAVVCILCVECSLDV